MRRDRPQASCSRYCRRRKPILGPLIPGRSVAGDQDPSRFLVRGPMPRTCPDVSSPHLRRGRDLRCCALGKTDAGGGWLRVCPTRASRRAASALSGPRRAEGGGGRHVRAHWFGHAHLPMSGCANVRNRSHPEESSHLHKSMLWRAIDRWVSGFDNVISGRRCGPTAETVIAVLQDQ